MFLKKIFLLGFMGSGKSSLGQKLAQTINWPFIDMDAEIEKNFKMPISKIFAKHGEDFFRRAETKLLKELQQRPTPAVIATGGGLVEAAENRDLLKNECCLLLEAPFATIWRRLNKKEKDKRPLALNKSKSELEALYLRRLPLYQECAADVLSAHKNNFDPLAAVKKIFPAQPSKIISHRQSSFIAINWEGLGRALANKLKKNGGLMLLDKALSAEEKEWQSKLPNFPITFPQKKGEASKTMNEALGILKKMDEAKMSRDSWMFVRGGGSLTDLGGFCGGLYRRGTKLFFMPTTLLGAADAAVGGKTALNFSGAKNQLGLFYLPEYVIIEPQVFLTLTPQMITDGLVEIYKMGLISDPSLAALISESQERLLNKDLPLICHCLEKAVAAKAKVVSLDFKEERGIRDVLNLGHTFGHVMESYYAPKMSHGQAVAYGLAVMAHLSYNMNYLELETREQIVATCRGLSNNWPALPPVADIKRLIMKDKKIRQNTLKFVLLKKYGQTAVDSLSVEEVIEAAQAFAKSIAN